jgi:hypothetical protein
LLTIEGVRFASISKKTPLSKLSFAFVSLALPLLVVAVGRLMVYIYHYVGEGDAGGELEGVVAIGHTAG